MTRLHRLCAGLAALLLTCSLSPHVSAQTPDVAGDAEPSEATETSGDTASDAPPPVVRASRTQVKLNEAGIKAMIDGDFEAAVAKFEDSLAEGELNITYLNLGRALFKLGRCNEAMATYAKVSESPVVDTPSLEQVRSALAKYHEELDDECLGFLETECEDPDVTLRVDGGDPLPCAGDPVPLMPGAHEVVATSGAETRSWTFDIRPRSTLRLVLVFEGPQPQEPSGPLETWAWLAGGLGASMLVTAAIIEFAVLGPDIDDYEAAADAGDADTYNELKGSISTTQGLNAGLYIGGALLVGTGAALYLYPMLMDEGVEATAWVGPGSGGVSARWRF